MFDRGSSRDTPAYLQKLPILKSYGNPRKMIFFGALTPTQVTAASCDPAAIEEGGLVATHAIRMCR
jgi:hypothetical protein